MKLTQKQKSALEWLAKEPWTTPWWGGRPFTRWPKELPAKTYDALSAAGLVDLRHGKWSEKTVQINERGKSALSSA